MGKAADLPVGSVVGQGKRVYLKTGYDLDPQWIYAEGGSMYVNNCDDEDIDAELADGAVVLREGY